ncbi:hypothetical protein [Spiroplasma sp. BIUS-1]|uniref:hypothetical protein n=1 Tax=Spiroplasma sp. BIUS-1 TaxID=216964 RepID=UPI001398CC3A|nr:hypothetical protein [Spiroplasma sp. BIUS-1]QHX36397.1 hypothetical protein SBIUS_v1c01440 [Spiroplasma sp. BIUS-1]
MKKRNKNNLLDFVDRLMLKRKNKKLKKCLIISSIVGLAISLSLSISIPLLIDSSLEPNIYYKFDNKYFNSKDEVYKYSYTRSINNNYSFESDKYIFDDKVFNTKNELDVYIENKFKIKNINTNRNPKDYLINTSGELSSLVKTNNKEKIKNVYKGFNGSAFLSKQEAASTYLNNYSLNYKIDGQLFDNVYSAREYYLNVKLKQLEESELKTICYEQGGMCQTKEQITSWLRDNTVKGFEYKGKDFSNLNYEEFLLSMNDLDREIIDKNIEPVLNGDRSSYWVTQKTKTNLGYFVGPKYFESNQSINSLAKFQSIKSYDLNLFMLPLAGWVFAGITNYALISSIEEPSMTDYDMISYLKKIFEKLNLNENLLKDFKDEFYDLLSNNLAEDLSYGLSDIKDSELSDFYRLLISFKRFLDLSKIYDILELNSIELEHVLKEIIVEILNSQKDFMNNMLDIQENGSGADILLDPSISFDDIYSLFLNTSAFFNDGGSKKILRDISEKILKGIDNVVDVIGSISGNISKVKNNINVMQKSSNKTDEHFSSVSQENHRIVSETLVQHNDEVIEALGLNLEELKAKASPLVIGQLISSVWNIGKMFSFISLKTYEAKLDSNQSLYYFEPTFKVPLLNISFGKKVQDQNIYTLNESPLSYFSPKKDGKELKELYEFNGKFYKDKNLAIEDLKYEIYKKPEKFLKTKELFTSVLSKDNSYILNLPKICGTKEEQEKDNEKCISSYEYEQELAKEKEQYVQRLFKQYYEDSGKEYYLDGFGGAYDNKEMAIQQLKNKVDHWSNYQEVYTYSMYNNKIVKNTKEEIQEYIKANQYIESKKIIDTDLIQTSHYESLKENNGYDFEIYEMNFYGQVKYFRSHLEAMNYLDKKVNYEVYSYNREEKTYTYKGIEFINEKQLEQWVDKQIEIITEEEFIKNGGEQWYVKTYFNSVSYN